MILRAGEAKNFNEILQKFAKNLVENLPGKNVFSVSSLNVVFGIGPIKFLIGYLFNRNVLSFFEVI